MEWVETTGETIDVAKDLALDQLGVDEQEAEFEVLEDAEVGWFGRLKTPARVRARVRPRPPRPKVDGRDRRRSGGGRGRSGGRGRKSGGSGNGRGGGNRDRGGRAPAAEGRSGVDTDATEGDVEDTRRAESSGSSRSRRSRGGERGSGRGSGERKETSEKPEKPMTDLTIDEQAELAKKFLTGLADAFGLSVTIDWEEIDDDLIELRVGGEQLGSLIGPEGRTLYAVQELTRTALQAAASGARTVRLRLDVGGYREKRKVALERFVLQVVERVRAEGIEQALEPMGSADRKIVHDAVTDLEGVATISEGEEPRRRVVIVPE